MYSEKLTRIFHHLFQSLHIGAAAPVKPVRIPRVIDIGDWLFQRLKFRNNEIFVQRIQLAYSAMEHEHRAGDIFDNCPGFLLRFCMVEAFNQQRMALRPVSFFALRDQIA